MPPSRHVASLLQLAPLASTFTLTTLLSGFASLATLAANVLISRSLPIPEVGRFGLLMAVIQIITILGAMGQPGLTKRLYSLKPLGEFDWLLDLRNAILFGLPALGATAAASIITYRLGAGQSLFVAVAALFLTIIQLAGEQLNSQRRYVWASLTVHLPNGLMLLPAAAALAFPAFARLPAILAAQMAAILATTLLAAVLLALLNRRGHSRIPFAARWQGLGFAILLLTHLAPFQGLLSLAGRLAPLEALAAYTALGVLIRPFHLLQGILIQILSVEVARRVVLPRRKIEQAAWGSGGVLAGAALLLLPQIASFLYGGRFDGYLSLVAPLALSGALLIPEVFPRSYVTGRATPRLLNGFIACQALIVLLGGGLAIWWSAPAGVTGVAWAGAVMILLRTLAAYAFYLWMLRTGQDLVTR